jgi:hypothetical protein
MSSANSDVTQMENDWLASYLRYSDSLATDSWILKDTENKIGSAEWWQEVGVKIESATNKAEAYAGAIGKLGNIDASDLAYMTTEDSAALEKY